MSSEFVQAIEALGKEKGINSDVLFQAVEEAVVSAYKKNYDSSQNVRVEMSKATGEFHVFEQRKVVEQVVKPHDEISLEEALNINPNYILGDIVEQEVFPKNFSRVALPYRMPSKSSCSVSGKRNGTWSMTSSPKGKTTS